MKKFIVVVVVDDVVDVVVFYGFNETSIKGNTRMSIMFVYG